MMYKIFLCLAAIALTLLCLACNLHILKGYHPDNVLEEFVENEIEHYTGLELDLSPKYPEK